MPVFLVSYRVKAVDYFDDKDSSCYS